jgi:F0F1-type ATP synthase alpha subunit
MAEQVIILVGANTYVFSEIPPAEIQEFRKGMLEFFHAECSDIITQLETYMDLPKELSERIEEEAMKFRAKYKEMKNAEHEGASE